MTFPWPQWESRLKELAAQGETMSQIAQHLSSESGVELNRRLVRRKAERMGLEVVRAEPPQQRKPPKSTGDRPVFPWNDAAVAMLRKLWAKGESASAIADKLALQFGHECDRNRVIGKVHRLGLEKRNGKSARKPRAPQANRPQGGQQKRPIGALACMQGRSAQGHAPLLPLLPLPPERKEDIPEAQRCSLVDLSNSKCRWPVGDPHSPDFYFCGGKPWPGVPYCECHARIAYSPGAHERLGLRPKAA